MVTKDELVRQMHQAVEHCFEELADAVLNNCDQNVMLKNTLHKLDVLRAENHALRQELAKAKGEHW